MQKQNAFIPVSDGTEMNAYIAAPYENKKVPAVLIFQEAYGVNHHIRNITERIAAEGYVAIAPELFHRSAGPGFEAVYDDLDTVRPHTLALTTEGLKADILSTFEWLQQQDNIIKNKIGSLGFCMGGRVSFMANALLPLSASVSYYSGGMLQILDMATSLHAPQLFFWAGLDKHVLPEQVEKTIEAVKSANKEYISTIVSYADHGFNCDERKSYHPKAAKECWSMSLSFLQTNLT